MKSELEYEKYFEKFKEWRAKDDWEWLYENLKEFDGFDTWYYSQGEEHYSTFEKYIRQNLNDFISAT